jgi:precorrin-2 dehydrogenase / sirohydrochlorin ferrochelatase
MSYYPIVIQLEGMTALVVGGGGVARRKVAILLEFGANISIVSRGLTHELARLVDNGDIRFLGEEMEDRFFDDVSLVIAATDDPALNRQVSDGARSRGLLVNAVDQPADCTFIVPSIVRRGDLLIAVSTSGKSPALSKKIRKRLEAQFGDEYAEFLDLMGGLRQALLTMGLPQQENSRIFHEIVDSGIIEALARGDREAVAATLKQILPVDMDMPSIMSKIV